MNNINNKSDDKKEFDIYEFIQKLILAVTFVIFMVILFNEHYDDLGFMDYVNPISFIASMAILLITIVNKIKLDDSIIDSDKKVHIRLMYKIISGFLFVSILLIVCLMLKFFAISTRPSDLLGIVALGIALSTEFIAIKVTSQMTKKSKKKFKNRYNDFYNDSVR
ncbi:hypothetical protein [Priestia sp. YIM B13491]|uniref:hypothetical protein n=1 Tax=Priestia sp. YIM B13491 TaxID=3366312 RepID=UPI003670B0A0